MAGKIPRRTPEEQAEYDERTRQAEEWMQRAREGEAQRQEAVARAGTRRRRLRRFIPFIPA
jgi:hypothetical protein